MDISQRIGMRLKELREERSWTQQVLARKAGVSQSTIAGLESGAQLPGAALLGRMSDIFRVNLDFFYREKVSPFEVLLRAEDVSQEDLPVLREANELCIRYRQIELLAGEPVAPTPAYPEPPARELVVKFAERVAEQERLRLDVGFDPTVDLPRVLESQGVRVLSFQTESALDGFFMFSDKDGAFVLVNTNKLKPKSRQMFTLAHEYAHVLLHQKLGSTLDYDIFAPKKGDLIEKAANAFAAAFLMPGFLVMEHWKAKDGTVTAKLIWLKRFFGVSYSALGWRLLNLGLISSTERAVLEKQEESLRGAEMKLYGPDKDNPVSIPKFSDRLRYLAQKAYLSGNASLEKLAEWLDVDIVTADEMARALRHGEVLKRDTATA